MRIGTPAAAFELTALVAIGLAAATSNARAAGAFRIEKDDQGAIRPLRAVSVPLAEFVREYSRLTGTPISSPGSWERNLTGSVTLFLRRPMKPDAFAEVFHRVLADNGYAAVEAPGGNGWLVVRSKDARDAALPVHAAEAVPDSARLVTAHRELKHARAEDVARMMRSFMPASSRIIPASDSLLLITDVATNIRKLDGVISRMDTPEGAKRIADERAGAPAPKRACGETRIEKLVVERLEVQDSGQKGGSK